MDSEASLTGPQITVIRNRLGSSQSALAKRIGSSQAALSRKETNSEPQKGPEIILISLLAKEAGIEVPSHDAAVDLLAKEAAATSDEAAA